MDTRTNRMGDYQRNPISAKMQIPAEPPSGAQPLPATSQSSSTPIVRLPKLLTEPNVQMRQECPSATPSVHILQPYREEERVPLFLVKMWNILEDPEFQNIVRWDKSGYSFHILDPHLFCREVLPRFFKHNNLNSLIRQLNMYGFRKMTPIDKSSLARSESDQDHLEFSHPHFIQQHPELLVNIKRKTPSSRNNENNAMAMPTKEISLLVDEIRQLREKQRAMENKMAHLVKENEAMWQQMSHLRNQHVKQQHVVSKLVQFLVSLVQPSQKRLGKRNLLAIDELQIGAKRARMASTSSQPVQQAGNLAEIIDRLQREITESAGSETLQNLNLFSPRSNQGPIIADVTDEPESGVAVGAAPAVAAVEPVTQTAAPGTTVVGCQSTLPVPADVPNNPSVSFSPISMSPSLDRQISEELEEYLSGQEQGIGNCRDLLGSCWESVMAYDPEDEEQQRQQQQPLMLQGCDPLLALNEAPTSLDLLTPLASPTHNNNNNKQAN